MNLFSAACFILLAYSNNVFADVACTTSSDCGIGGTCALSEVSATASLVCCSSSSSSSSRYRYVKNIGSVCTGLAVGMKCGGENSVCASGVCGIDDLCTEERIENESPCSNDAQCASGECARSEADATAGRVCCSSGGSIGAPWPNYVCTGLAAGMKCGGENRVCASGVCGIDDTCKEEPIGNEIPCTTHSDCGIGTGCAMSEVSAAASLVCCSSGSSTYVEGTGRVCTGLATGVKCGGVNSMCASGACGMDGLCKEDKIENESPCRNDAQCASGVCARSDADLESGRVCCASGSSTYVGKQYTTNYREVCAGLAVGMNCGGENRVCASGVCGMDGLCKEDKIENESPCRNDAHCASGVCALSHADADAVLVCCASGSTYVGKQYTTNYREVCAGLAVGMNCGGENSVCASGVCGMDGLCKEDKIENESPCRNDAHCASGVCARSDADLESGRVCCASGSTYVGQQYTTNYREVCAGLAVGMNCGGENSVCASGVCGMDGLCKEDKIENESPCRNDAHCASGVCARSDADLESGRVCCASGSTYVGQQYTTNYREVCAGLAVGMNCGGENSVCASGVCGMDGLCKEDKIENESPCRNDAHCASGVCARSDADLESVRVCCASGSSTYVGKQYTTNYREVCAGLAVGMNCGGENSVCASGVCGMDGLCKEDKIENESPCRNDAHCASGVCARSDADLKAVRVCCSSGSSSYVGKSWTTNYREVCAGLAVGMNCGGENSVCRSGSCDSNNLCTKQLDGSSCNGNNDDCVNDTCGQAEAVLGSEFICCPSGKTLVGGSSSLSVCTNNGEENQACFDDSICKSSVCVTGLCQGSKKWGNEPCEKDTHCHSGRCESQDLDGLGSCKPFASLAAKNNYINDSADCPLDVLVPPDASDTSSVSIKVSPTSMDTEVVMFGQEVLGGVDECLGSFVVQRQGSQVCFAYQGEDDNGVESSITCVKKCVDVCSRNAFYCDSDRFEREGKTCYITVKSEEAEADGNNEENEVSPDLPSFDDILFGDNDVIYDYDIFDDPDAIEDMFDPDSIVDAYSDMIAQAQGISTGVAASVRISLFVAASNVLLFW